MTTQSAIDKLSRGTTEIINLDGLKKKLSQAQAKKRKLRVKAGFDPTASDIHLGHVVLLRKLRQFQDIGHEVIFLIGDFTAQIGDPTGRNQTRPRLDSRQIKKNAATYQKQAFKILDVKKTKVVFNSSWLAKFSAQEILELSAHSSVAQMLARADFKKRYEENKEISLLEFMYPLLQAYDSVHLKADIELGGSDQKFNLLMGRQLQEIYGQDPQIVLMTPLLEGTDGVQKMSKSLDNYIGITEAPNDIFGKVMSISDELMVRYFEYLTDFDLNECRQMHPKEAKMKLAYTLVAQFHDEKKAKSAREYFEKTFSHKETPKDALTYELSSKKAQDLASLLVLLKLADSKKEVRRLCTQGAISFEGQKIAEDWLLTQGTLKIGKRRFLRII